MLHRSSLYLYCSYLVLVTWLPILDVGDTATSCTNNAHQHNKAWTKGEIQAYNLYCCAGPPFYTLKARLMIVITSHGSDTVTDITRMKLYLVSRCQSRHKDDYANGYTPLEAGVKSLTITRQQFWVPFRM